MSDQKSRGTGVPEFRIVEDNPRRLVLATGAARWIVAAILAVIGLALAGGGWLAGEAVVYFLLAGALFVAGAAASALNRKRWIFDAARGTVVFESLLWGDWEAKLGAVSRLEIASRLHGPADQEMALFSLLMTIDGRSKPVRVNSSPDLAPIRELKVRIEAIVEPWRRSASAPRMLG